MADKTTVTNQVQLDFAFTRNAGNDTASRTLTFDTVFEAGPGLGNNVKAIATSLSAGPCNWVIQPTGWRDSDRTEEAWQTVKVTPKLITKTVTELNV